MNFANADMVGHTGKLPGRSRPSRRSTAASRDPRSGLPAARAAILAITADHGNAEQMLDPATGEPHTAHTTNPVPFIVCTKGNLAAGATLADVAPTLLGLQAIEAPPEMKGRDLRR